MTVDPEARRAQHMLDTNAQYLQTVLLNIISTESSYDEDQERSSSNATLPQSSINDENVLYQVGSHGGSIYA